MKIILILLLTTSAYILSDECLRRTIIPVGLGEDEVKLSLLSPDSTTNRYSVFGFFIDSTANFYFLEEGTGKIKVFSESGVYLRSITDNKCPYLFLYGNEFVGTRYISKVDKVELILFSKENGTITYHLPLSFGTGWTGTYTPYRIKNGMLLFSSELGGEGTKKAFDIKRRRFLPGDFKEWDDSTEQMIYSRYGEYGAEAVGKLNNYYLFWFPSPHKDTSYEYSLRAVKVEAGNITHFQVNFKWQDVGYNMPDLTGTLIDNRYIYTIGLSRIGKTSRPEIWITKFDLKVLLPGLWSDKINDDRAK